MVLWSIHSIVLDVVFNSRNKDFNFVMDQQAEEAKCQGNTIEAVQKRVREILKVKVVIGFAAKNDFEVLGFKLPNPFLVRDFQESFQMF